MFAKNEIANFTGSIKDRMALHILDRIQGISDEFIPPIVELSELDEIVDVWDGDAILMAQKLARTVGLAVGISAGANIVAALRVAVATDDDSVVTTVIPDSNKKYLSTELCRQEPYATTTCRRTLRFSVGAWSPAGEDA